MAGRGRDALVRLGGADPRAALAVVCLLSLALRSEEYPVVVELASAQIRAQDLLFGALIALSLPLLLGWARAHRLIAIAIGAFSALAVVAALRSPVGASALVAVGKYLEFLLAGAAIALNVRRLGDPSAFTWALVVATGANLAVATVDALSEGGALGPLAVRAGGLLALESAATLAIVTLVWCLVRLSNAGQRERRAAIAGIVAAHLLLLSTKSVLVVAALLALALISTHVSPRRAHRAAVVGIAVVLALVVTVGRQSDVRSAVAGSATAAADTVSVGGGSHLDERSAVAGSATAAADTVSVRDDSHPRVPPRYTVRQPEVVVGGSFVHRVALAYVGARIALDSPLLGRGWQTTSDPDFLRDGPYDRYMVERFPELDPQLYVSSLPNGPHNAYIQLVAEAGWPALAALVLAMLAAFLAGLSAVHRRATDGRLAAVGVAWLAVSAVFLMSSSLFGGQLETSILGAAIVLATPATGLALVRARVWAAVTAALVVAVGAVLGGLLLPASPGRADPIARVRALTDRGAGSEIFRRGGVPRGADVVLDNGLVQSSIADGRVELRAHTVAARRPASLALVPRAAIARQVITHREADVIALEARDIRDRPVLLLTVRRGIPAAFITLAAGYSLHPGARGALLHGARLQRSTFPVVGARLRTGLRRGAEAVIAPLDPTAAVALVRGRSGPSSPAGSATIAGDERRILVGMLPRLPEPVRASAPDGSYLAIARGARARTLIAHDVVVARSAAALVVPFQIDDRAHSGLVELVGHSRAYNRPRDDMPR